MELNFLSRALSSFILVLAMLASFSSSSFISGTPFLDFFPPKDLFLLRSWLHQSTYLSHCRWCVRTAEFGYWKKPASDQERQVLLNLIISLLSESFTLLLSIEGLSSSSILVCFPMCYGSVYYTALWIQMEQVTFPSSLWIRILYSFTDHFFILILVSCFWLPIV